MDPKKIPIKVDTIKPYQGELIQVVAGDNEGNMFVIELTELGKPYDIGNNIVQIVFHKPDGTKVTQSTVDEELPVSTKDNYIYCILKTNTIAAKGKVVAEIQVTDGIKLITSAQFYFAVRIPLLDDNTIQSSNEYPLLIAATNAANNATGTALNAAESATSAAASANSAAAGANAAKDAANTAASSANSAAAAANSAASSANSAAESANSAAAAANAAADSANTAAQNANDAAAAANAAKDGIQAQYDAVVQELASHKTDYATYKDSNNLKIAKIEKELNDYQQTMANVNVNQEAKQKASGYGVVSLPKNAANGQVSGSVKGETRKNLAPTFDKWKEREYITVLSPTKISFEGIDVVRIFDTESIQVKPNTIYSISILAPDGGGIIVRKSDESITYHNSTSVHQATFTTDTTTTELYIRLYTSTVGTFIFENVLLEEGNKFGNFITGTKSTISASRLKSVDANEENPTYQYVVAKDSEGNIAELRSLPNGTKDEVRVSGGVAEWVKMVSDEVSIPTGGWAYQGKTNDGNFQIIYKATALLNYKGHSNGAIEPAKTFTVSDKTFNAYEVGSLEYIQALSVKAICQRYPLDRLYFVIPIAEYGQTEDSVGANAYVANNLAGTTLTYQLAEPIEIPVQVSGTLTSYPNGTIYIERILPDAGVYTDKITILHQDALIKRLDKLSKIDFMTGVETELDINQAEISEDKLSFTHPDLSEGDIAFFEYEYDVESTEGETEVEYYDSRYVVKDDVTGKFYKWNVKVSNGTPTIEVVEV